MGRSFDVNSYFSGLNKSQWRASTEISTPSLWNEEIDRQLYESWWSFSSPQLRDQKLKLKILLLYFLQLVYFVSTTSYRKAWLLIVGAPEFLCNYKQLSLETQSYLSAYHLTEPHSSLIAVLQSWTKQPNSLITPPKLRKSSRALKTNNCLKIAELKATSQILSLSTNSSR